MYASFIRPIIEYGSQCCLPRNRRVLKKVEKIQRHYVKRIPAYRGCPYAVLELTGKIEPLQIRRIKSDLVFVYNAMYGNVDIDLSNLFTFSRNAYNVCSNGLKLTKPKFQSSVRMYCYTIRVIDVWNSLPPNVVVSLNAKQFKKALHNSINFASILKRGPY